MSVFGKVFDVVCKKPKDNYGHAQRNKDSIKAIQEATIKVEKELKRCKICDNIRKLKIYKKKRYNSKLKKDYDGRNKM